MGLVDSWHEGLFRPSRFMTVYGIHLGGYAGGALATAWAVMAIRRQRRAECVR